MELFGWIELFKFFDLGHNFSRIARVLSFPFDFLQNSPNRFLLLAVALFVENDRPILRASVVTLTVQGGGIMNVHEDEQYG